MNTTFSHLKHFLLIMCCLLFSCISLSQNLLPNPEIKRGIARISGQVINLTPSVKNSEISINCIVNNLLTGRNSYDTTLNSENQFHFDIPIETSTAIAGFNILIDSIYNTYMVGLSMAKELVIDITLIDENIKIVSQGGIGLSSEDMVNAPKAVTTFYDVIDIIPNRSSYYKMSPEKFAANETNSVLPIIINKSTSSLKLTKNMKVYLTNTFNLEYIKGKVFWYKEEAETSYQLSKDTTKYTIIEPAKSYYSFLSKHDLNDPKYIYSYSYPGFLKSLLNIKAFDIPRIVDSPIENWLDEVKSKIKDIVGFDNGLFYDMLVANEFILQLSHRNDSLSNKQINNINSYPWEQKGVIEILLQRNEELKIQLVNSKNLNICQTPTVPKEKLMESILLKYKGKVVIVDFWATWCAPCREAIKEIETLKYELKNKDVVFVYLANESSPLQTWKEQIKIIGGEQYYITNEEWEYLLDHFNFNSIPTYLIFSSDGVLKNKFISFPGVKTIYESLK